MRDTRSVDAGAAALPTHNNRKPPCSPQRLLDIGETNA